jgi:tripartite-type tricarboxylate transporter receptor subunit TctC
MIALLKTCPMISLVMSLMVLSLMVLSGISASHAAEFPAKPLRMVVPFSADGGVSMQARQLAEPLSRQFGQQVLVQHWAGAGGLIASEVVARSPADGHTLLFTTTSLAINTAWLGTQLSFSIGTDLAPVRWLSSAPLVLAAHPAVPARSVPELVALAKRGRPVLKFGANAPGSLGHVALSTFSLASGFIHEPALFNGGGAAAKALLAGEVDALFIAAPVAVPLHAAKRLRLLAVASKEQLSLFAGVPVLQRFYPGLVFENRYGLLAPVQTPQSAILRLDAGLRAALAEEKVRSFFSAHGLSIAESTSETYAAMLKNDVDRYSAQMRSGELRLQ